MRKFLKYLVMGLKVLSTFFGAVAVTILGNAGTNVTMAIVTLTVIYLLTSLLFYLMSELVSEYRKSLKLRQ